MSTKAPRYHAPSGTWASPVTSTGLHSPACSSDTGALPTGASAVVMEASRDRNSATVAARLGEVPWLHTVAEARTGCEAPTLTGPLTEETTRSGAWPTAIRSPNRTLLLSTSSGTALAATTFAATYQSPPRTLAEP